jgi:hypothetical protein
VNIQQLAPTHLQNSTEISESTTPAEPQQSIWPMGDFVLSDEPFGNGLFGVSASFSHLRISAIPWMRLSGLTKLRFSWRLIDRITMDSKRLGGAKDQARERSPSAFAGIVWLDKLDMADAQCVGEFEKRHDRWIAPAVLQAHVLLA